MDIVVNEPIIVTNPANHVEDVVTNVTKLNVKSSIYGPWLLAKKNIRPKPIDVGGKEKISWIRSKEYGDVKVKYS